MRFQWRPFKIDVGSFKLYLDQNYPSTDGVIADPDGFDVLGTSELTDLERTQITEYYNSLTEESEILKLERPSVLLGSIQRMKESLAIGNLESLTYLQKKVLFNMPISETEEDFIISEYPDEPI